MASTYEAPDYEAPKIVWRIGQLLRVPRKSYTTEFADLVSADREMQLSYMDGMIAIGLFFSVLYVIWVVTLIILKCKGNEVGCAAGLPFQTKTIQQEESPTDESASSSSSLDEQGNSTGSLELDTDSVPNDDKGGDNRQGEQNSRGSTGSFGHSCSYTESEEGGHNNDTSGRTLVNKREKRTRICFLIFSLIALVCVPVTLVFSFGPMKEAARSSDVVVDSAKNVLEQLESAIGSIETAADAALEIINDTPTDIEVLCPKIPAEQIELYIGVDIEYLAATLEDEFEEMSGVISDELGLIKNALGDIDEGIATYQVTVDEVEAWMWIVPGLLLSVSLFVTIAILGVLLAWKEKSGKKVQQTMSYFVLPGLFLISTGCWAVVIIASFGTMTTSDMCTGGVVVGSPDDTIQQIMLNRGVDQNETVYQTVTFYTNRCMGPDPVQDITDLERSVQDNIDVIWRQISKVDSIGRSTLTNECGSESLTELFEGARELAKLLTAIRRSLNSAGANLACAKINAMYTEAVHETFCTDTASAAAYGFIMFFVLAISTMVMVTLRASWLQHVKKDKVYHDEDEVAENMILDEHEEYLAYISRYKHEWQEYQGFREGSIGRSEDSFGSDSEGVYLEEELESESREDAEGYNGSDECSDLGLDESSSGLDVDILPPSSFNPAVNDGARSCGSDDISYPSMRTDEQSVDSSSIAEDDLFKLPSPLLPPAGNPDYMEKTVDNRLSERGDSKKLHFVPGQSVRQKRFPDSGSGNTSSFFTSYGVDLQASEQAEGMSRTSSVVPGALELVATRNPSIVPRHARSQLTEQSYTTRNLIPGALSTIYSHGTVLSNDSNEESVPALLRMTSTATTATTTRPKKACGPPPDLVDI